KSDKPTLHVKDTCQPKNSKGTRVTLAATATERDPTPRITSTEMKNHRELRRNTPESE
ncbi:unnamed protein product, partial [Brassica rapa]